jgi:hypothetical protein
VTYTQIQGLKSLDPPKRVIANKAWVHKASSRDENEREKRGETDKGDSG